MRKIIEFIEKRLHPRYPVGRAVNFEITDGATLTSVTGPQKAVMADISRNGCSLLVDKLTLGGFYLLRCIESRDAYAVAVRFAENTKDSRLPNLSGYVRWIDNASEGNNRRFRLGIEFIPPLDSRVLDDLRVNPDELR